MSDHSDHGDHGDHGDQDDLSDFKALGQQQTELDELRAANRKLQIALIRAKAKTADLVEAVYQAAKDAALIQGNPPPVPKPKPDRRARRAETGLLLCSDWHVGKRTVSFNSQVAAQRIRLLGDKVAKIADIERADHPVRECHALLAGDMVDNTNIFPGHAHEVDSTMFEQVFTCVGMLEHLLRHLLSSFERVHVWEQTGNHGRIGKKGDYPRSDNLDMLVYRITRDRIGGLDRLVWHPRTSWYTIVQVGAYSAMLIHGDQIKSFGGNTPAFGILRKANAWASGVVEPFVDVTMGHFHQDLRLPMANGRGKVFVNPALESDSDYAREMMGATGTPGQRLNFIDPERGRVTSERVLWLDDQPATPTLRAVA